MGKQSIDNNSKIKIFHHEYDVIRTTFAKTSFMKKIIYLVAIAALAVSCKKDKSCYQCHETFNIKKDSGDPFTNNYGRAVTFCDISQADIDAMIKSKLDAVPTKAGDTDFVDMYCEKQ